MRSSSSLVEESLVGRRIGGGHSIHINATNISGRVHSLSEILSHEGVAVRRLGRLGDMVMLEPLLRYLDMLLPVVVITDSQYSGILNYNVASSVPSWFYLLDLEMYAESHPLAGSVNRIDLFASSVGVKLSFKASMPRLVSSSDSNEWVRAHIPETYIVCATKSLSPNRTWNDADEFAKQLGARYPVIAVDTTEWGMFGESIPARCINDLYSLIKGASLVISPDSGPMHLAGAARVPFIAVYVQNEKVSENPQLRCRYYSNYTVIDSDHLSIEYALSVVDRVMNGEKLGRFISWG